MHDARAEHQHHLRDHELVIFARGFGRELEVVQARRGVAFGIGDEFHQQHAVEEVVRHGHAHAGSRQAPQRVDLGVLPRLLDFLAPVAGALGHGAGAAAVLDVAALRVVHGLAERALFGLLVDLGAADVLTAAHHEDDRLLAAHQLAHDRIDEAFLDQRQESFRGFDGRLLWNITRAILRHPRGLPINVSCSLCRQAGGAGMVEKIGKYEACEIDALTCPEVSKL